MGLRHVWALQSSIAPPTESIALLTLLLMVATVVATYLSTDWRSRCQMLLWRARQVLDTR
jgi:hypothetical protein